MSDNQPFFRFHPRAYELDGVFEQSSAACDICDRTSEWSYKGNIYSEFRPTICARCIAENRVREVAGEDFSFHDTDLEGARPELAQEVLQRIPGVSCFNPYRWPVVDGEPLAFIG